MAVIVYLLCGLTSGGCAGLLLREYRRSRSRLLLWTSLAFVFLTISNVLIFVDFVVIHSVSLALPRALTAWVATALLVFGLIWDAN
jgi:hypothetical protein